MKLRLLLLALPLPLTACATDPNDVMVQLAPEVISSIDGTLQVHSIVLGDRDPVPDTAVDVTIAYTDRNGTAHVIAPSSGKTDKAGAYDATFTGLIWDGTGTVTATVSGKMNATGTATFAVLDRTPPVLTIMPPAAVHMGTDVKVSVHITDEIGVSQVLFDTSFNGNFGFNRDRSIVASGSTDTTVSFDWAVPDNSAGTMITLYALGEDLSGNQAAAQPVTVTVVP